MRTRFPILPIGYLLALLVLAGCELIETTPLEPGTAPSVLGEWVLTATIDEWTASGDTNGIRAGTELPSGVTCRQEGRLVVTEQRPNGALSWFLDRTTTCTPPSDAFKASEHFADTWEWTRWAWVIHDSVNVRTPFPLFSTGYTSCTYPGTIEDDPPSRLTGNVRCGYHGGPVVCLRLSPASPCTVSYYQGTWEARRPQ